jgi:hypothetical protein
VQEERGVFQCPLYGGTLQEMSQKTACHTKDDNDQEEDEEEEED